MDKEQHQYNLSLTSAELEELDIILEDYLQTTALEEGDDGKVGNIIEKVQQLRRESENTN